MDYIVAAIGEWNRQAFFSHSVDLPGAWYFVSNPKEMEELFSRSVKPRYIFFPHWRWIVPPGVVDEYECVCFHMTDVPYGRGGSPLQNLIIRGHKSSVLSALKMEHEVDAGPVYLKIPFDLDGSAEKIYKTTTELSWSMIKTIVSEQPSPTKQEGEIVEFKRRNPSESKIPENLTASQLYDFIRMLDAPGYPRAFIQFGSHRIEFDDAKLVNGNLLANVEVKPMDINHD